MKHPKGWMSLKSYKKGFKAGKSGKLRSSCPYKLCEDCQKIMLKKLRWEMGWEEASYRPKKREHVDNKELERIAAICPKPKSGHEKHMMSKKKPKKKKRHAT